MSRLTQALAPLALFFLFSASATTMAQTYSDRRADEIKADIAQDHPAAFYVLAGKLFDRGDRDEAVFWFYAGQLRYRVHLACNPDLPPDGDPALFGALSDVIGHDINRYAFGDLPKLLNTLDEVIDWDAKTDDALNPKDLCGPQRAEIVAGLEEFKAHLLDNADMVRSERSAQGLENR